MEASRESVRRQRLDRYELLAEIASGGMATVYLGRLPGAGGFQRFVAIKRLHPHLEREQAFVDMFLDEARIAAQLHHPNVVSTLEIGTSERGYYLVMDYIEGDTLARLMVTSSTMGQRVPVPVLLRIVHDSLSGLHAAHELRTEDGADLCLVHRDVSPQNILIGTDGTARITDFGVARAATRLSVTREGQLKGKLGYMAPEQARGGEIDRRTDLFAVGVILWEALAGRRLFRGRNESDAETLHRILYEEIPRVSSFNPNISPELDEVVAHALAKDPEARFQDGHAFADALEQAALTGERIGSSREVARFVEEIVGKDISARREAIKAIAPSENSSISSVSDMPRSRTNPDAVTAASVPKLLTSSMTPNSMSVGDLSTSMPLAPQSASMTYNGLQTPPPPPAAPSGTSPLLVGVLVGVSIAALMGATALFMSSRNNNNNNSGNNNPVAAAPASVVVITVPASATAPATVTPSASAVVTASASAAPTTRPVEHKSSNKPSNKGGDDGLAPSPYH